MLTHSSWLERFLFEPSSPTALALCRIAFFGLLGWTSGANNLDHFGSLSTDLWQPVGLAWLLGVSPPDADLIQLLQVTWRVSLAFCCLGFFTRLNLIVTAVLSLFLLGLSSNFGKISHSTALPALFTVIFAFSRCGDALSVDRLLIQWIQPATRTAHLPSTEYRWPFAMAQSLMCLVMFAAAIAKLRASGLEWCLSDNLRNLILKQSYTGHEPPLAIGLWLAQFRGLCRLVAVIALSLELFAPLALVNQKARMFIVPGLFLAQVTIWLVLGVSFRHFLVCYVVWLPWQLISDNAYSRYMRRYTTTR